MQARLGDWLSFGYRPLGNSSLSEGTISSGGDGNEHRAIAAKPRDAEVQRLPLRKEQTHGSRISRMPVRQEMCIRDRQAVERQGALASEDVQPFRRGLRRPQALGHCLHLERSGAHDPLRLHGRRAVSYTHLKACDQIVLIE